jgi:L-ascorbate metabolism protein UlaG (beta-lactamase superfamily)
MLGQEVLRGRSPVDGGLLHHYDRGKSETLATHGRGAEMAKGEPEGCQESEMYRRYRLHWSRLRFPTVLGAVSLIGLGNDPPPTTAHVSGGPPTTAFVTAAPASPISRITKMPGPSDLTLKLDRGQVAIEYIAHACFRIHTPRVRVLIDPYASRGWISYNLPLRLAADAVLITHPHDDHDAGVRLGREAPWAPEVKVLTEPGKTSLADARITGIRGKHADPYGKEFGQRNTIWLIEAGGLRIVHVGDNGPLTAANIQELGRIDILMLPIDAKFHILKEHEIRKIRSALRPRVLIPMHYLPTAHEASENPGLGLIDPWLAGETNVVRLGRHHAIFSAASLLPAEIVVVFRHSPAVPGIGGP